MKTAISEFQMFVEDAQRLLSHDSASDFLEFIEQAQRICDRQPKGGIASEFKEFIDAASPMIVDEIRRHLPTILDWVRLAGRWLVRHDLLWEAGLSFVEDSYTNLMRWALDPSTHPASALKRQRAWLEAMGLRDLCGDEPCAPLAWERTDDGIPDLVMRFPSGVMVIEAKTGSSEHATPSGAPQTMAYPEAVRRHLGLTPEARIEMVFITPDGRGAANGDARCTTFVEFAMALARALDTEELPTDTRYAYATVVTHFLTCAVSSTASVRELLDRISEWSARPDWAATERVLQRQGDLLAVKDLFLKGGSQ